MKRGSLKMRQLLRQIPKWEWVITLSTAILLSALIIALSGCGKHASPVVRLASPLDAAGNPTEEAYQIPVEQQKIDEPAGGEGEKVLEIVVPPSDKTTTLHVKAKKASLRQAILPKKKDTSFDMVSDNPQAKAHEEARTPWWYWALGIIVALAVAWYVIGKYLAPIKLFFGSAWSLISRVFTKR